MVSADWDIMKEALAFGCLIQVSIVIMLVICKSVVVKMLNFLENIKVVFPTNALLCEYMKEIKSGLEKWLSVYDHFLLFQRT